MPTSVHYGDFHVTGTFSAQSVILPASVITDANVAAGAQIAANKLQQQYAITHRQPGAVAAAHDVVHLARAAGEVIALRIRVLEKPAAANSYTVTLKKNGTAVSTAVTIDNTTTEGAILDAIVSTTSYSADDALSIDVVLTGGGAKGNGLCVSLLVREGPGV